jgi:DnaJ-class molecular chaperone
MTDCRCVHCGDCGGSGQITVPTPGYPEWDLESCSNCRGSGIAEMCEACELAEELAEEMAESRWE